MNNLFALFRNVVVLGLVAWAFSACTDGWNVGAGDEESAFNRRFHYYYGEDCRHDAFGQSYDCSDIYSLNSSMTVHLSITYDGYATLCVDDDCSRYDPGEYTESYSHGVRYYDFEGDDTRMIVYADGSEVVYIDYYEKMAYYYYYSY